MKINHDAAANYIMSQPDLKTAWNQCVSVGTMWHILSTYKYSSSVDLIKLSIRLLKELPLLDGGQLYVCLPGHCVDALDAVYYLLEQDDYSAEWGEQLGREYAEFWGKYNHIKFTDPDVDIVVAVDNIFQGITQLTNFNRDISALHQFSTESLAVLDNCMTIAITLASRYGDVPTTASEIDVCDIMREHLSFDVLRLGVVDMIDKYTE